MVSVDKAARADRATHLFHLLKGRRHFRVGRAVRFHLLGASQLCDLIQRVAGHPNATRSTPTACERWPASCFNCCS